MSSVGLLAQQDNLSPIFFPRSSARSASPRGDAAPGEGRQPWAAEPPLPSGRVSRYSICSSSVGSMRSNAFSLLDQPLFLHLYRLHHGTAFIFRCASADVESVPFDGELEVLDFLVMLLGLSRTWPADAPSPASPAQTIDRFGRADTSHHILALGVHQVFAIQLCFHRCRIARKCDTGARIVPQVAKHHGADIDRGAIGHIGRDFELTAIVPRACPSRNQKPP